MLVGFEANFLHSWGPIVLAFSHSSLYLLPVTLHSVFSSFSCPMFENVSHDAVGNGAESTHWAASLLWPLQVCVCWVKNQMKRVAFVSGFWKKLFFIYLSMRSREAFCLPLIALWLFSGFLPLPSPPPPPPPRPRLSLFVHALAFTEIYPQAFTLLHFLFFFFFCILPA